tara:strand:+ start:32671 stop:33336 length:666 start_codon:yes stop_codon:yes gene_type:complete
MMRILAYILPFIIVSSALCQQSGSSSKVNVIIGIGYPEIFHGGIRVNQKQWHFDASSGTTFQKKEFAVNGNVAYHFGSKKLGEDFIQKLWYTSIGMAYMQWAEFGYNGPETISVTTTGSVTSVEYTQQGTQEIRAIGKEAYINVRLGRDFRINRWLNLSLSFGLGVNIHHNVEYFFGGQGMWGGLWIPVNPSGQFSLQFKLFNQKEHTLSNELVSHNVHLN